MRMGQGMLRAAGARTFSSLKIRNYRYYFAGQSLSLIGTWMQSITQSWLVFAMTRSGTDVGLITAAQTLPVLLFGPIGGTIADRFGKYRILLWTQTLAGVQAAVLAALALSGHLQLWELFVMALSLGFVNMIDNPTRQTFIVEMVGRDQLVNAVTLNSVMVNVARVIGPAVAGILIASVGSGWCFLINAVSFVFVVGGLRAIRTDELIPTPRAKQMKGQLVEGFRYVAHRPLLRNAIVMMAIVGCLTYEFQTTLPLMAGETFHGNSATYGYFTAFMGIGAVVGGLIAAGRKDRSPRRMVNTLVGFGLVLVLAALAPPVWVAGAGHVAVVGVVHGHHADRWPPRRLHRRQPGRPVRARDRRRRRPRLRPVGAGHLRPEVAPGPAAGGGGRVFGRAADRDAGRRRRDRRGRRVRAGRAALPAGAGHLRRLTPVGGGPPPQRFLGGA